MPLVVIIDEALVYKSSGCGCCRTVGCCCCGVTHCSFVAVADVTPAADAAVAVAVADVVFVCVYYLVGTAVVVNTVTSALVAVPFEDAGAVLVGLVVVVLP